MINWSYKFQPDRKEVSNTQYNHELLFSPSLTKKIKKLLQRRWDHGCFTYSVWMSSWKYPKRVCSTWSRDKCGGPSGEIYVEEGKNVTWWHRLDVVYTQEGHIQKTTIGMHRWKVIVYQPKVRRILYNAYCIMYIMTDSDSASVFARLYKCIKYISFLYVRRRESILIPKLYR